MPGLLRSRRSVTRLFLFASLCVLIYLIASPSSNNSSRKKQKQREIRSNNILERIHLSSPRGGLDTQRNEWLQARMGREEDEPDAVNDVMGFAVRDGIEDYWERFQKPVILGADTHQIDAQLVRSAVEDLMGLNGWVAKDCPTLLRPFSSEDQKKSAIKSLADESGSQLYYIALVVHSADHFLVDQLATIVQLAKKLGPSNIFVSMLDYYSTDATPTLLDLSEAVLTLLGVPFRIRRVPGMTQTDLSSYYPMEEAYTRNLVLEPLHELYAKRAVRFSRVIWLRGFTCPQDILESLLISYTNNAALVCGMDWAEHNSFFIFSDRWRTRDIKGDQFRQSKSTASPPPRDEGGARRYREHLPFQVFCCESGTHVVDPGQSYYKGIEYRYASKYHNLTYGGDPPKWDGSSSSTEECMDSSQAFFCRDLWVSSAREGLRDPTRGNGGAGIHPPVLPVAKERKPAWAGKVAKQNGKPKVKDQKHVKKDELSDEEAEKRQLKDEEEQMAEDDAFHARAQAEYDREVEERGQDQDPAPDSPVKVPEHVPVDDTLPPGVEVNALPKADDGSGKKVAGGSEDSDANRGSDFDAIPEEEDVKIDLDLGTAPLTIPNSLFSPARILVNPRCVTTYAGVSHAKLAQDLFGLGKEDGSEKDERRRERYELDDWEGAPESFVCQEQRSTGGRKATKTQRRLGFSVHEELGKVGEHM